MKDLADLLTERLAAAAATVTGAPADPVLRRSQHADFQANGALALGRTLRRQPREVAEQILAAADLDDLVAEASVAGPGFINLTVTAGALDELVAAAAADERLGLARAEYPEVVVVDYSAPNIAKEMHVGHLRSTIIGDAVVRLLEWLGHDVRRENHIGDWGTPFGMLIEHLLDVGEDQAAHKLSIGDLNGFYQAARRTFDADEGFQERSRRRVVALQRGDAETLRLWRLLVAQSEKYFLAVYGRLGVRLGPADFAGESSYNDQLDAVVGELDSLGLLRESDGALCVFPAGFTGRDGEPQPLIVRKRDGGYGYAATDLATIRDRTRRQQATRMLYVVGLPQRQHLEMIFQAAREAGWLVPPARAEHIGNGSVLGTDGKVLRTRAGASLRLIDLLDEAVARAGAIVAEKNPDLDDVTRKAVAEAVGIGAVKYGDLSADRHKDYVFDWDRMLAFDGNTAPYLQMAHARVRSIFRRGGVGVPAGAPVRISEPAERALALELLGFGPVLRELAGSLQFHKLTGYLYDLATAFTAFYEHCPVLRADDPAVRDSRLVLCDVTARTLARGLDILGIQAPDRM